MTKTEIERYRKEYGLDIEIVDHWECPEGNSAKLLTMPNIPQALHGPGLQPRTIYGRRVWDMMRKNAYANADYKSEITGVEPGKGKLHAHELFSVDYAKQESVFIRCIAIAKIEHDFIHSGRLVTLYQEGNLMVPKSYLLSVVENGFKIISSYNEEHPDEEPLRCYGTFLEYLKVPSIKTEMLELMKKYNIKFYQEVLPASKRWKGWHVIVGNKRYDTPYKCQDDWAVAMKKARENDTVRNIKTPFDGPGARAIEEVIRMGKERKLAGCKNGRISKRKVN